MDVLAQLKAFRQDAYERLGKAHDATFELTDAVMLTRNAYCLADFSLCPVFRRKWSSIYEALQDCRPQRQKLMQLYIKQMPDVEQIILAGDHTAWSRPEAVTLQERTSEHYTVGGGENRPITKGQGYSTIAWIPEAQGSWALPLRHERITSWESPIDKAVWQLSQVCQHLPQRPISLWDSEYGCAPFVLRTAQIAADKLMRLRSNLTLYGAPLPYCGKGRPRLHGDKFKLNDSSTWSVPVESLEVDEPQLGRVQISLWQNLHFRKAAGHPMSLLRVERLGKRPGKAVKPMWLTWIGQQMPTLAEVWRLYLRRFAVDHWYRFLKQRLHWTLPKLSTPKQCERWSDLMPLITWELWLARDIVTDRPLPWQNRSTKLTPGRVAQAMAGVIAVIGTPALPPKPRGKSPGWITGQPRLSKPRYPVVKKSVSRRKQSLPESA
ncbi:NF041680 family putative transposase [Chroococcidiopsis sp. CCMEE 29]|uniref:NF041680 family putative transposase n=1 Tax=Chroococcidiopsis sp. CCMEE 29 TaxID=155894 RepID=UPI002022040D|nr:NF041680 family putative transposase [Chroococcidiopsis sp. CCMEE 29]